MKLKIKNKAKFITSTTILFTIIIFIFLAISNITFSHAKPQYKEVTTIYGDTLWSIACNEKKHNQYYQNKDIRYIVYDIQVCNNLKTSNLQTGQTLVIPTF